MSNFAKALQAAFQHRWTVFGAFASSLLIAVLWGGNIGALYPILAVVLEGKSLQEWVDDEIQSGRMELLELGRQAQSLRQDLTIAPETQRRNVERQLFSKESRLAAIDRDVSRAEYLRPWVQLMPKDPFQTVVVIVVFLLLATMVKDACIVWNLVLVAKLIQRVSINLQQRLYDNVLRSDMRCFQKRGTSQLLTNMTNDLGGVCAGLSNLFGGAIREPLKMATCLFGAAYICWRLLALSLILAPVAALLLHVLAKSIKRASRRWLEQGQEINRLAFETFNGIQTVQAYTMESVESERFADRLRNSYRKSIRIVWYTALTKPATEVLGLGVVCLALLSGAYLVLNQTTHILGIPMSSRPMSLQTLLVFYGLLIGASDPARKLSDVFSGIQGGIAAADRFFPVLEDRTSIIEPETPIRIASPHQQLTFDQVFFHYDAAQPVLRDIRLTIPFGETVAIVGPNGCGKSSLANLVPRFYDPTLGDVRLDGVSLRDLAVSDLRKRIGVVSQSGGLFEDTVANNIAYGSPHASREQIVEAARQAFAHQFIEAKLEDGYETVIGPGGNRLSGGQRQRIALARAILRNPEILILDEATSQVDIESEQLVHKSLERFVKGRTTIIITHRMATLALAHRIVVMEHGRIQDVGTHDELMQRSEVYRRLHEIQLKQSA